MSELPKIWYYKRECHRLIQKIWGTDKQGRVKAYVWLNKEFGQTVHFAQINEMSLLMQIRDRLFVHLINQAKHTGRSEFSPPCRPGKRKERRSGQRNGSQVFRRDS